MLFLVTGLLIAGGTAHACSCAPTDLGRSLPEADGAFVGTFVDRQELSDQVAAITFQVETVIKGEFGPTAVVRTNAYGASCGLEFLGESRTGSLLDRSADGVWQSGLCSMLDPGQLLAAGGGHPPDPSIAPVSAGWTVASIVFVGALVPPPS